MTRDFKYSVPGIVFYVFLIMPIILSQKGLIEILSSLEPSTWLLPVLSLGVALVTTNGIGFIFVTITYFIFNIFGGYSKWFKKNLDHLQFEQIEGKYSVETKFVYAYWYDGKKNENPYDEWVTRRWSTFFANLSSLSAIILGSIVSLPIILRPDFGLSWNHVYWLLFLLLIIASLIYNSCCAKKESLELLNLFILGKNRANSTNGTNSVKVRTST